jgi:hypothetical protein
VANNAIELPGYRNAQPEYMPIPLAWPVFPSEQNSFLPSLHILNGFHNARVSGIPGPERDLDFRLSLCAKSKHKMTE